MSHAKYLSSSPCGFGEEDFSSFHYNYVDKETNDPRRPILTIFVDVH